MKTEANNRMIKACILAASLICMCYVVLIAAIADIAEYFPQYDVQVIQTGVTTINLMNIFGALLGGWLSLRFPKKRLIVLGLSLVSVGGVCGFFFHGTLSLFYTWSVVIGMGMGLFLPLVVSLTADYFEGLERNKLAGMQTSFINGGGVALTFAGGLLASIAWQFSYLAFLAAIPVLVICLAGMPPGNKYAIEKAQRQKIPGCVIYYFFTVALFMLIYNAVPSNLSLFLNEGGFGHASLAGEVGAVFMCGGVVMGVVFSKFSMRIGEYLFGVAYLMLAFTFFVLCNTQSIVLVFIAAFFGGTSISMTMPQALFSVAARIPPAISAVVFSLVASVAPSLGNFVSPAFIAFVSGLVSDAGDSISRYTIAGILAVIFACTQFLYVSKVQSKTIVVM